MKQQSVTRLICFDMDGTLLDCETLDLLGEELGIGSKIKEITDSAMEGNINFEESFRERIRLLKGISVERIENIAENLPFMPGAKETVKGFKDRGYIVGIITGGIEPIVKKVARSVGADFYYANRVEIKDLKLTGDCNVAVSDNKGELLRQAAGDMKASLTIAVGDGANDLSMLQAADIGIAFRPKQKVKKMVKMHTDDMGRIDELIEKTSLGNSSSGCCKYTIVMDKTVHKASHSTLEQIGDLKIVDTRTMDDDLIRQTDILIVRTNKQVDREFIEKASNLKIVATATTGLNHIDQVCAKERHIEVINAPGENAESVADYIFRMLLNVTDDVCYTVDELKRTKNFIDIKKANRRYELSSKSIGIIGYGNVGTRVARRARAFGMCVKIYDPYVDMAESTLEEVLGCDIVTLHPELTEETRHMIDEEQLELMKESAILINASRGEVVTEKALIKALKEKQIALAILDVYENEPNHTELFELENAVITPHIAGNTVEARVNASMTVANKIMGHVGGTK
ncbi:phosphoserine phosphatase SerB [Candidatus Woesearchaeota archaeon]|nr:phosphoserine phosphatase SerB [Candidatus Woesearchaeota archaeon]